MGLFSVRFQLQGSQFTPADKKPIVCSITWRNSRVRFAVGITIPVKNWDQELQRAVKNSISDHINLRLREVERHTRDFFNSRPVIDKAELKDYVLRQIQPNSPKFQPEKKAEPDLVEDLKKFIIVRATGEVKMANGVRYSNGTLDNFRGLLVYISEFAGEKKIKYSDLTDGFFNNFYHKYLSVARRLSHNSLGKNVALLKTFLREMSKSGRPVPEAYKNFKFSNFAGDYPYLSEQELEAIESLALKKGSSDDKSRDVLLFLAWTGLRYSDYHSLRRDAFNLEKRVITVRSKKTDVYAIIPINPVVYNILQKYHLRLPKLGNLQLSLKFKDICKAAGIVEPFSRKILSGGQITTVTAPKWQNVSCHTCRRSFVTNMLKRGFSPQVVMKISGHKSLVSFQKYFKVAEQEAADILLQNFWK